MERKKKEDVIVLFRSLIVDMKWYTYISIYNSVLSDTETTKREKRKHINGYFTYDLYFEWSENSLMDDEPIDNHDELIR